MQGTRDTNYLVYFYLMAIRNSLYDRNGNVYPSNVCFKTLQGLKETILCSWSLTGRSEM